MLIAFPPFSLGTVRPGANVAPPQKSVLQCISKCPWCIVDGALHGSRGKLLVALSGFSCIPLSSRKHTSRPEPSFALQPPAPDPIKERRPARSQSLAVIRQVKACYFESPSWSS